MIGGSNVTNERTLGKRLQIARQNAQLTQQGLCAKANLSYSTLAKIERGAIKSPSIFTIQAIAEALNVGLDELMGFNPTNIQYKTSKSGLEFIYFDINGCLVRFFERAFSTIARDYNTTADIIESVFWRYNDECSKGIVSLDDFNKSLADAIQTNSINWQDYYLKAVEIVKPMQELLEWTSQNYHFGILSNSMPGTINAMFENGLLPKLNYDVIIDSSEVGSIKPDPIIYDLATRKALIEPAKILLIDDTKANLVAAEKKGWHVIWFDYANPEETSETIKQVLL